jgi:rare lipoprotein A
MLYPSGSSAFSIKSLVHLALAGSLSLCVYGCAEQAASPPPPAPRVQAPIVRAIPHPAAPAQVTTASWYGPGFHGRRTSNGEVYNQAAMTAASRTLPIGSHARVTNLTTGKSVVLRINDRGPWVRGRGIDLSHAAARRIGIDHRGIASVKVTRVDGHSEDLADRATDATPTHHRAHAASAHYAGPTNPPLAESGIIATSVAR